MKARKLSLTDNAGSTSRTLENTSAPFPFDATENEGNTRSQPLTERQDRPKLLSLGHGQGSVVLGTTPFKSSISGQEILKSINSMVESSRPSGSSSEDQSFSLFSDAEIHQGTVEGQKMLSDVPVSELEFGVKARIDATNAENMGNSFSIVAKLGQLKLQEYNQSGSMSNCPGFQIGDKISVQLEESLERNLLQYSKHKTIKLH